MKDGNPTARALAERLGVSRGWLIRALKAPVRSKKGKLGCVTLNAKTGWPDDSYATHCMRRLEGNVEGGKYDVAQKLQAAGGLMDTERRLIELIMQRSRYNSHLAALVAEAGVDPARVIKLYAEGAVALGKADALAVAAANLGSIARQLIRQAALNKVSCNTCFGSGKIPKTSGYKQSKAGTITCTTCKGEKTVEQTGPHYKFAVGKLLDITRLSASEPNISVNNSTSVAVQQNTHLQPGGYMERLSKLTDGNGRIQQALPSAEEAVVVQTASEEDVQQEHSPVPAR